MLPTSRSRLLISFVQSFFCYLPYCLLAPCPCCVGCAREHVSDKYNLAVSQTEPDDCSWCLVKCIGMRMLCVISVCFFPCIHVTQMRAELAYRRHGEATLCPCCCRECGDAEHITEPKGPDEPETPGYPTQQVSAFKDVPVHQQPVQQMPIQEVPIQQVHVPQMPVQQLMMHRA